MCAPWIPTTNPVAYSIVGLCPFNRSTTQDDLLTTQCLTSCCSGHDREGLVMWQHQVHIRPVLHHCADIQRRQRSAVENDCNWFGQLFLHTCGHHTLPDMQSPALFHLPDSHRSHIHHKRARSQGNIIHQSQYLPTSYAPTRPGEIRYQPTRSGRRLHFLGGVTTTQEATSLDLNTDKLYKRLPPPAHASTCVNPKQVGPTLPLRRVPTMTSLNRQLKY